MNPISLSPKNGCSYVRVWMYCFSVQINETNLKESDIIYDIVSFVLGKDFM